MAGVEILNQIPVTETEMTIGFGWLLVIAIAIFAFFFAICGFDDFGIVLGGIIAMGVTMVILILSTKDVPTGEYRYEVIVEDTVNLQEFYDYYEVVEQRGEIFVVEERVTE